MKTLLSTAAAAALLTSLSAVPAVAQDSDDGARAVSPDEYFGTRAREATAKEADADAESDDQDDADNAEEPATADALNERERRRVEREREARSSATPSSDGQTAGQDESSGGDQDEDLAARLRRRDAERRSGNQTPASAADAEIDATGSGSVTVMITGLSKDGDVFVALQTESGFASGGGEYTKVASPRRGAVRVTFDDVAPGDYAAAVFQDTDGDGTVTLGRTGPTEPWGLSGDVSGAPKFADAKFSVTDGQRATTRVALQGGEAPDEEIGAATMAEETASVTVRVENAERRGQVYIALQTEDEFAKTAGSYTQVVRARRGGATATFDDVEPGEYAVAVFQDTDRDGAVTLTKTGPTEPWGLSGSVSGAPTFEAAMIDVSGETEAVISLMPGAEPKAEDDERPKTMTDGDEAAEGDAGDAAPSPTSAEDRGMGDMDMDLAVTTPERPSAPALVYRRSARLSDAALTATDYLGADMVSSEGAELAEIADIIVNPETGAAQGIVLATGGIFGLGADYYAVNFDRVATERGEDGLIFRSALTDADVEKLRDFPYDDFKDDTQGLLLASQLAGAPIMLGRRDGDEAEIEDVIMGEDGSVQALVVSMGSERLIAPFADVRIDPNGDVYVDAAGGADALALFTGRGDAPRRGGFLRRN